MEKIRSKVMQETSRKIHKAHKSIKKWAYIFYQLQPCKNITKWSKMHQETHSNFFRNFARKLEHKVVQITRIEVCIATNSRKNKRNPKPTVMKPKPTQLSGSGSPDPDTLKPRSNGCGRRKLDRVWTDPVQRLYKRKRSGSVHFVSLFLFLLRRFLFFSHLLRLKP